LRLADPSLLQGAGLRLQNPAFTNEQGASLVLGENLFAMLPVHDFFKTFTSKEIAPEPRCKAASI
jgi:predicted lactoylglutathione lyase